MICKFCNNPVYTAAAGITDPPMCHQHLDLAIFISFLMEQDEPVTIKAVQDLVVKAKERDKYIALTVENVPELMAGAHANQ